MSEKKVQPQKQIRETNNNNHDYTWSVFSEEDTGLRLVTLKDEKTGISVATPLANPEKRTAAHAAWAGARHSRAPGTSEEILHEMGEKGINPDEKLEETFKNYGHASVADMARGCGMSVHVDGCPMHVPFTLFNLGELNSGQEKSTRYQKKFGKAVLHSLRNYLPEAGVLEQEYQELGTLSLQLFSEQQQRLVESYRTFYQPTDKNQETSLQSRVLDTVRFFLLMGQNTGFVFETSARDWSRKIGDLKASPLELYRAFAQQLEMILAPPLTIETELSFKAEAPSLIRHTQPNTVTQKNLAALNTYLQQTNLLEKVPVTKEFQRYKKQNIVLIPETYSPAQKMVAQYILSIIPGLHYTSLLEWIQHSPVELKKQLSTIIFSDHTHKAELTQLARTTGMTYVVEAALGEQRDFNRQRGHGRFIQHFPQVFGLPLTHDTADQILATGYCLPLYVTDIDAFHKERTSFETGLHKYYDRLFAFVEKVRGMYGKNVDHGFVLNLLPLAHRANMWMHGDPKQTDYFTKLRVRPGGHINYRALAYDISKLVAESDPLLSAIALPQKPDPANREEFFSRA